MKRSQKKVLKKHREPAQETNKQNEHEFAFCPLFYIKGNLIFKAQFIMLASKFHHFVSFAYANLVLKTIFFLRKPAKFIKITGPFSKHLCYS